MHTVFRPGLFVLFSFLTVLSLGAQDFPYELNADRELALFGLGAAASASGHLLERNVADVTVAELRTHRRNAVFFLDRAATFQRSEPSRLLSDQLLKTSFVLPFTLVGSKSVRSKPLVVATMLAQTALLNEGITKLIKVTVQRKRPFTYNLAFGRETDFGETARQSFVSGHTSNTAALIFFTAKVFHDLYPESKLRPYVWTAAALLPALTGYTRYRAGKHYPTDIIAGYALGATIGMVIPQLHKRRRDRGFQFGTTSEGVGLSLRW